jgi:hypothetical protein
MRTRDELAWEIICQIYADEEENAVMIANSIGEFKSTVNSVLYERRNLFSQRSVNYSARPLWSLTQDSIDAYEQIHASSKNSEERINTPLFCGECGSLHPNHTPVCSQFILGAFRLNIPSKINSGSEIGLPKFFGIEYSQKDSEVAVKNRREIILEFMITEFVPVDSNRPYVESYGDPRSDERRYALINHLQGINVPASSRIQELRNNDIVWLNSLNLDTDLP